MRPSPYSALSMTSQTKWLLLAASVAAVFDCMSTSYCLEAGGRELGLGAGLALSAGGVIYLAFIKLAVGVSCLPFYRRDIFLTALAVMQVGAGVWNTFNFINYSIATLP